ncbi:B-lymphocyte antigen CD20-like isoform X2 [Fukomys damarensis]|nr:B-lymphocyte antigen CD20-like isoform X2 [Fukomys damarensis]
MPRRYFIREETSALGASQIMIALFHCALGGFWIFFLQLDDEDFATIIALVAYSFSSALFFIMSGSSTVIQKVPSRSHRIILATVMNILSVFTAIIGLLVLGIEFAIFEEKGEEYSWSNMAGMMLIQYLFLTTITELVIACMVIHWMRRAFHHEAVPEEFS